MKRKRRRRGDIDLHTGPMFSGKTEDVVKEYERIRSRGKGRVPIAFKPTEDTRSSKGFIETQGDEGIKEIEAHEIPDSNPWKILEILRRIERQIGKRVHRIFIDETQFFKADPPYFFEVVNTLLDRGYNITAAGLVQDAFFRPFGATPQLLIFTNGNVHLHIAKCELCGEDARFTQLLLHDGTPAPPDSPQILVGGKKTEEEEEYYEARCRECHVIPKRKRKKK